MEWLELARELDEPVLAEIRERLPFVCTSVEDVAVDATAPRVLRYRVRAGLAAGAPAARRLTRERLRALVDEVLDGYRHVEPECIAEHATGRTTFAQPVEALKARGELVVFGAGQVGLSGMPLALLHYFDGVARRWARELGAAERHYPSLVPLATLARAGHPQSFPQHLTVAAPVRGSLEALRAVAARPEAIDPGQLAAPEHALAPAVCYHCYAEWAGRTLDRQPLVLTARGHCFRHEAAHFRPLERLWDFTMREIVVLGARDDVERARRDLIARASALVRELGLDARIETASDPFFTRDAAGKRLVQRLGSLKFELRLATDADGRSVAVASFNHHQDYFGRAFDIRQPTGAAAESGCVAFGLERWVFAFLSQHGLDEATWPEPVRVFCRRARDDEFAA